MGDQNTKGDVPSPRTVIFDERMPGGGRFKDMDSGQIVSEEEANKLGVFKPMS